MSYFEHGQKTPWGYFVDAETLPNFIDETKFNAFTNRKFVGDTRIAASIPGATQAIRNYCGWHVSPNLSCGVFYNVHDLRDAFSGPDLLVQLPATFVTGVSLIVLGAKWNEGQNAWEGDIIDGDDTDRYDLGPDGLLRVYDAAGLDRKARIFVHYYAGIDEAGIAPIEELAANLVSHTITNPYGVNSESAGGVSVSYSSIGAAQTNAAILSEDSREVLQPYKTRGVF